MNFPAELMEGVRARGVEQKLVCIYIHSPCMFQVSRRSSHGPPEHPQPAACPPHHPPPAEMLGVGGMSWGPRTFPAGTPTLAGRPQQLRAEQQRAGSLPAERARGRAQPPRGDPVLARHGAGEQDSSVGMSWGVFPAPAFPLELGKEKVSPLCTGTRRFLGSPGSREGPQLSPSVPFPPGCLQCHLCLLEARSR